MENKAFLIGVIGGLGLGMLIGSELSGTYTTIVGAVLLVFTIGFILYAVFILKQNKLETEPPLHKESHASSEQTYDERRREVKNYENKEDIPSKQIHRFRFIKR
jgi:hypothetical protein